MEEDKPRDDKRIKGKIMVLTRPNVNSLIKAANLDNIKMKSIITILKGDNQYHLIYSE